MNHIQIMSGTYDNNQEFVMTFLFKTREQCEVVEAMDRTTNRNCH